MWIIYWRINSQWGLIIVFYPCSEMFCTLPSDHCPDGNHIHFCRILVAKAEFCKVHASLVHLLSFYSYVRIFSGNKLYISYFLRKAVVCGILSCSGCSLAQWWPSAWYMPQALWHRNSVRRDKADFRILPSRVTVLGCRTARLIKHPTCIGCTSG